MSHLSCNTQEDWRDIQSSHCVRHPSLNSAAGHVMATPKSPPSSTRAPCTTVFAAKAYRPTVFNQVLSPRTYWIMILVSGVLLYGGWCTGMSQDCLTGLLSCITYHNHRKLCMMDCSSPCYNHHHTLPLSPTPIHLTSLIMNSKRQPADINSAL